MKAATTTARPRTTPPLVLADQVFDAGHGVNAGHGYTKLVVINRHGQQLDPVVFPSQLAEAGSSATRVQPASRCELKLVAVPGG